FLVKFGQALLGGLVVLALQRFALNLQLNQAPIQTVQLFGLGVDLHANAAGSLVDQVDGLIRQLAVGDVAMGEFRRGDDRAIGDGNAVVNLVAFFQAAQYGDGVLLARLIDLNTLEAPFQRRILLDVLTVFVQRGRTYAMQLAPRQRRFEHIAGVHGTLGLAGANHGVQLIDKEDDTSFLLAQLIEHGFQTLLELTAKLGASDQRTHVQRQQALVLQAVRDLTVDDTLGQPLDDGGLAHAGLANQHRVVLGTPLRHLDASTDFVVASGHRIELAVLGALGHVDGVLVQRLPGRFAIEVVCRFAATQIADGTLQRLLANALRQQQLAQAGVAVERSKQHQLAGDVLISFLLCQPIGLVEQARQVLGHVHVAGGIL